MHNMVLELIDLQDFVNDVQTAIDNKMNPIGLFMDLSKAYDVLDHKLLLNKLNEYGITGTANSWVESYLSNRKQYVELKSLKRGKANILITGKNTATVHENLNNAINAAQTWFSVNRRIVNTEKTKTMFFRNYQNKSHVLPQVLFEGSIIPVSIVKKFLGIHISERLKWNDHCDSLKSKLNTGYYVIYILKKVINPHVCRTMYFACFHTHLKYGITVWGNDPQSRKIFLLQKKVVRLMCNVNQQTSCRNLFRMLGILPLPCIYRVSHKLRSLLQESVPCVKIYRYNQKHLCPKLNGYGYNGHRKVWASVGSTYCTPSVMPYSSTVHAQQRDITVHCSQRKVALTSQDNRRLRPA
jgi:hypothetical protein